MTIAGRAAPLVLAVLNLGYRVSYHRVEERVGAARLSSAYPQVSLTGPKAVTARAVTTLLRDRIAAQRRNFVQVAADAGQPDSASEEEISASLTVDRRTGRQVRLENVFASPAPVDRAVRSALLQRDVDPDTAALITVGPEGPGQTRVDSAPTPKGLWVGVSHCIATCALGPIEVTVPWSKLPAPRPGALPPAAR